MCFRIRWSHRQRLFEIARATSGLARCQTCISRSNRRFRIAAGFGYNLLKSLCCLLAAASPQGVIGEAFSGADIVRRDLQHALEIGFRSGMVARPGLEVSGSIESGDIVRVEPECALNICFAARPIAAQTMSGGAPDQRFDIVRIARQDVRPCCDRCIRFALSHGLLRFWRLRQRRCRRGEHTQRNRCHKTKL